MKKRKLEVAVISDVHLGSLDCHADELNTYLNSIQPKKLVLNGDILDIGQFHKRYFPQPHMKVIRKILNMAAKGTQVFYVTGNRDEIVRKLTGTSMGNVHVVDKLILRLDGKKAWFFHGDVFDTPIIKAKWLAKCGSLGYHLLFNLNKGANYIYKKMGRERPTLSHKVENEGADSKYVEDFEKYTVKMALRKHYDYVVCGHLHQPKKEDYITKKGTCTYLNSGDWVKSLTALEYSLKRWKLYRYQHDKLSPFFMDMELREMDMQELFEIITTQSEAKLLKQRRKKKL
ncbi:UDP-2,3-diacylglucosamine diphosphatase [Euzebyella marina]|uniref:UDP-2,3-diacylglucosamine diphosphatase n=1 Tax=Euzebyella marina TaxID=1761453 RepID=A0A3G2L7A7_9FLAO|nr:UDP-2,3-diacylglucosamine diphosphatase [Euzebyella marina]AYN68150.1 UDP-2,3-diacylglucosamine diphosphatase [Euzebyella marina]